MRASTLSRQTWAQGRLHLHASPVARAVQQRSFSQSCVMERHGDRNQTIGFIGLGAMGNHMLRNLVTRYKAPSGCDQTEFALYDVNDTAVDSIIRQHGQDTPNVALHKCSSPYDVAQKASTIISMVPTGKHVEEVYASGEKSVLKALEKMSGEQRAATLCMDQSTIEQSVSKSVALTLRAAGAQFLDAPVSGGVVGAEKGTLAIMVGGDKKAFDRSVPVLSAMSRKVTHCGDLGSGLAAKIANNLLLGITMMGLSEAMLLGKRLGVDPQVLADIINSSTGRCWSSEVNHPVPEVKTGDLSPPCHRSYQGGFVTKLAHKDLGLAVRAAEDAGVPLTIGRKVEEAYRPLATSEEYGNRDFSVIYEYLDLLEPAAKAKL